MNMAAARGFGGCMIYLMTCPYQSQFWCGYGNGRNATAVEAMLRTGTSPVMLIAD